MNDLGIAGQGIPEWLREGKECYCRIERRVTVCGCCGESFPCDFLVITARVGGNEREVAVKVSGGEEFPFSNSPFSGIISHLTSQFGGNVHSQGIVNITSSSDYKNKPWQVADHGWNDHWYSQSVPNSWICFDFKRHSISLKNYTLKTCRGRH
jgi:hypothetical protein